MAAVTELPPRFEIVAAAAEAKASKRLRSPFLGNSMPVSSMIRKAIELEERIQRRYEEIAERLGAGQPELSRRFDRMAVAEAFHARRMEGLHRQFVGEVRIPRLSDVERRELDRAAPWSAAGTGDWVHDAATARQYALQVESDAIVYYSFAAEKVDDPELKASLREFCEIEQGHWQQIQNEFPEARADTA